MQADKRRFGPAGALLYSFLYASVAVGQLSMSHTHKHTVDIPLNLISKTPKQTLTNQQP